MGAQIVETLQHLPDTASARLTIPPREIELHLELIPEQLAIHGLQAADVLQTVNAAYHGSVAAQLNEADRSVPVAVRITHDSSNPQSVGALLLRGQDGALTQLASVAHITTPLARSLVDHQDGLRRQVVVASSKGADQVGYARAARAAIDAKVPLPAGVFLRYGGAAEAQRAARNELLLHSSRRFRAHRATAGAWPSGIRPSRAAGAAIAAEYPHRWRDCGRPDRRYLDHWRHGGLRGIVWHGGAQHHPACLAFRSPGTYRVPALEHGHRRRAAPKSVLTPVLLTALLTGLALLPVALQLHQPGHEIEGPMAVVILGGLVSSTLVSLLLIPPLAARWLKPE